MARRGRARRPGRRSGPGSHRRRPWPSPAPQGSRRTTGPGPRSGTAGVAAPDPGSPGSAVVSGAHRRSGGARFGGGTASGRGAGRWSASLPLLLVLVCDGRRGPADRWSGPGAAEEAERPRIPGFGFRGLEEVRSGWWLARRPSRGVDPEGGGVDVDVVGGGEADGGALDGRRDGVDDGAAEAAEGQTGPLVRSRERLGGAAVAARA